MVELCKDNPDVEGTWMALPRIAPEASGHLQRVPGRGGQTYLGQIVEEY